MGTDAPGLASPNVSVPVRIILGSQSAQDYLAGEIYNLHQPQAYPPWKDPCAMNKGPSHFATTVCVRP